MKIKPMYRIMLWLPMLVFLFGANVAHSQANDVGWFDKSRFTLSAGAQLQGEGIDAPGRIALGIVPVYSMPVDGLSLGGGVFREIGENASSKPSWYVGLRLRLYRGAQPQGN